MNRQPPAAESDQGKSGLLETVEARFAEADAERSAWLDDRIRERRGRGRAACAGCGCSRADITPGCAYREPTADVPH